MPQNLGRYQPQPRFPGKPWHRRRCLGREAGLFLEPLKTAEEKGDRKPCVRARSSPSGTFCCKTPPGAASSAGLIPCLGLGQQQGGAPGPAAVPSRPKLSQGTSPAHGGHNNRAAQRGLNGATFVPKQCCVSAVVTAQQPGQGEGNGREMEGAEISNVQGSPEEAAGEKKAVPTPQEGWEHPLPQVAAGAGQRHPPGPRGVVLGCCGTAGRAK